MPPASAPAGAGPLAASRRGSASRSLVSSRTGFFLTLPALMALAITFAFPAGWTIWLSLQSLDLSSDTPPEFVGLDNYVRILGSPDFLAALGHTLGFVAAGLALEFAIAMPIALALHRPIAGRRTIRAVVALPLMVAPVIAGLAWKFLFSNGFGLVNSLLAAIGISGPSWFASPWLASVTVVIANLWLAVPFDTLMLLAGLASLPLEIFEAARVDGAKPLQTFRFITLPLLRPVIAIILIIRLADAFRIFDIVYILTGGGPANRTDVLSTYIYRLTFSGLDFSGGAAASIILVLVTVLAAVASVAVIRGRERSA